MNVLKTVLQSLQFWDRRKQPVIPPPISPQHPDLSSVLSPVTPLSPDPGPTADPAADLASDLASEPELKDIQETGRRWYELEFVQEVLYSIKVDVYAGSEDEAIARALTEQWDEVCDFDQYKVINDEPMELNSIDGNYMGMEWRIRAEELEWAEQYVVDHAKELEWAEPHLAERESGAKELERARRDVARLAQQLEWARQRIAQLESGGEEGTPPIPDQE